MGREEKRGMYDGCSIVEGGLGVRGFGWGLGEVCFSGENM